MSSSIRGPQHGGTGAYVLHLERVCQLIERGNTLTVEINPVSDVAAAMDRPVIRATIDIHEGGDVSLGRPGHNGDRLFLGLTLANYKRVWRCWAGEPTEAQRRAMRWNTYQ